MNISKKSVKAISQTAWIAIVIVIIAVAAIAVAVYITMQPAKPARDFFSIGIPLELTGAWAREGNLVKRGYDTYRLWVNEKYGGIEIDGEVYRVEYVFYDVRSDPGIAADAMEKMLTLEDIDFVFGPMASATTLATAPICESYEMLQVTGSSESHLIPEQHFEWTFMTMPVSIWQGIAFVDVFKLAPEIQTVAYIYTDTATMRGFAEGFEYGLEVAAGEGDVYEVVYKEMYPDGLTDLTPLVTKAKAANPDVFVQFDYIIGGLIVIRNMKELDFNPPMLILYPSGVLPEFIEEVGKDIEYMTSPISYLPTIPHEGPVFGTNLALVEYYETYFGVGIDYTSAGCAATGEIFHTLLQKYKMTPPLTQEDRETLRDALENESPFQTSWGPITYSLSDDTWHSNECALIYTQIMDGELVAVAGEFKEADLVYPRPHWDEL